jgi:hypothetical protein
MNPSVHKTASSCEEHYRQLHASCSTVVDETLQSDTDQLQATSHDFVYDLEQWLGALKERPEVQVIKAGLREYQFALLAVIQGQYRQAFMALRLSFELFLGGVHLSANELELRSWLRGSKDIVWSAVVNEDNGVLSKYFVATFFKELANHAAEYRAIANKVYRECSEYVHGNAPTHENLPVDIKFSYPIFQQFHIKAKSVRLVTSFVLCSRYVGLADEGTKQALESTLLDNLGHISAIRRLLGSSGDDYV